MIVNFTLLLMAASPQVQWLGPPPVDDVRRVVTLAPSLTETMIELDAVDRLVGVTRFDEHPLVAKVARVGGFVDPSLEAITGLKPDLIVVQKAPGNQKAIETLARLGFSIVAMPLTRIDDVAESYRVLGRVLKAEVKAKALIDALAAMRVQVRSLAKKRSKKRVLMLYGYSPFVVAGPGSFAHELLEDCGATNLADRSPTSYPVYSVEHLVKLKPEVIVDSVDVMEGQASLRNIPQLQSTRWIKLSSQELLHPGPSLTKGLEELCRLIHDEE